MGNIYSSMSGTAFEACASVSWAVSVVFFLAPLPAVIKICKKSSVKRSSPLPYLVALMNCMVWLLYGHPDVHISTHGLIYVYVHFFGLVAEAIYVTVFLVCSPKNLRCTVIILIAAEFAFLAFVASIVLLAVHSQEARSVIVGVLGAIFATLMHASPLWILIQTKRIPICLSRIATLYAVCWTTLGFIMSEQYVTVPNAIGLLLGITQMVLYQRCFCLRSTSEDEDEDEDDDEDEEGVVTQRENLSRARRSGSTNEREFTILIVYPESRRGQQLMRNINCSPLVESGDTIGTVITWTAE